MTDGGQTIIVGGLREDHQMADHVENLNKLRKLLVEERRKLVAKMVGSKHKPTNKLGPLVEIRHALRAVDEAIEEEETKTPSPRKAKASSEADKYSPEVPED
jgi:hypothetical protein